ncbi:MAG: M28 family metallopeptidase [Chloroflexota bacterium]|nr:M28 family metallopeptidase [Chloroflexota bacterium]
MAQNVIATRAGGPETVVIGGHFDSVAAGPGANDNASGTAVVLELARVMASRPTPFTLKFAAFDAEEIGLLGSAHMVSQMSPEELKAIRAMINLDMVGVGDSQQLGGDQSLTRIGQRIAAELDQPAGLIGQVGGGSDHASFARAGVPVLFIYRANDPNYHSPMDRAEYVEPANLAYAGQIALGVIDALADGQ